MVKNYIVTRYELYHVHSKWTNLEIFILKRFDLFTGKFDLIKDYGFLIDPQHISRKRGFPTFRKPRDNCMFDMTLKNNVVLMRELRNVITKLLLMYT